MDSKQRNAAALHRRINDLVGEFSNQYRAMLAIAREDEDADFSQSAQKELAIKEGAVAIITAAQKMTMLIRDLQELWLFGGLDTLADAKDEEVERKKVAEVARMVEGLVGKIPGVGREGEDGV
ncbi:hypothetical protein GRF29_28g1843495 [Pseudopithomyces chartarum]|uniref:Mediator of RNA polymerase II transcription subunit 22 n=1 Tax=Pseudopithomyces chartarum TaxID=1892770 RepID=A0AAN6M4M1_9PLEO|nr:hypothetical protein GRF29_28g1843495 [Pseudopithomyces chartarum]